MTLSRQTIDAIQTVIAEKLGGSIQNALKINDLSAGVTIGGSAGFGISFVLSYPIVQALPLVWACKMFEDIRYNITVCDTVLAGTDEITLSISGILPSSLLNTQDRIFFHLIMMSYWRFHCGRS